jgi:hypothetical protein
MELTQALKIIDSGEVFSCVVVSFDKARKKGGERIFHSELKVVSPKTKTLLPKKIINQGAKNHFDNFTRTCFSCINGEETAVFITIHIALMLEINSEKIML